MSFSFWNHKQKAIRCDVHIDLGHYGLYKNMILHFKDPENSVNMQWFAY